MMLREETAPPEDALPVAELRDYLRLASGFGSLPDSAAERAALAGFLRAAMAMIEGRSGKVLLVRRYRMQLDDWRDRLAQPLPLSPVRTVESVEIVDADDAAHPVAGWRLLPDDSRPKLVPQGLCLPQVPRLGAVVVRFTAGFGTQWSEVPPDLAQAVIMLAAQYYEERGSGGSQRNTLPLPVAGLIERWCQIRVLAGRGRRAGP